MTELLIKGKCYNKLPVEYLHRVLNYEGGMTSAKMQKMEGFKTNRGITEPALSAAKQKGIVSNSVTIESLTTDLESVRKIYEVNYYLKSNADKLPHPLAFAYFDIAVNGGVGRAVLLLQETINSFSTKPIAVDGGFGPNTLSAFNSVIAKVGIDKFVNKYNALRGAFYKNLTDKSIAKKPDEKNYYNTRMKAWTSRLNSTIKYTEMC